MSIRMSVEIAGDLRDGLAESVGIWRIAQQVDGMVAGVESRGRRRGVQDSVCGARVTARGVNRGRESEDVCMVALNGPRAYAHIRRCIQETMADERHGPACMAGAVNRETLRRRMRAGGRGEGARWSTVVSTKRHDARQRNLTSKFTSSIALLVWSFLASELLPNLSSLL